jgi:GNAT superfamily N-acetyltransferase
MALDEVVETQGADGARRGVSAGVAIRPAEAEDAATVAWFLTRMLEELVEMGGNPPPRDDNGAARLLNDIRAGVGDEAHCYLLARPDSSRSGDVGLAEASLSGSGAHGASKRLLHIHALFVAPGWRRRGIGMTLLEAILDWGRGSGCTQAELKVLAPNPARKWYERTGFVPRQINMVREM